MENNTLTNDELRRLIAERLGWHQDGDLWFRVTPYGGYYVEELPRYSEDANAALALWETVPDEYTPRLVRILVPLGIMTRKFKGGILHNETMVQIEAIADTPARAICEAWLQWQKRNEKQTEA